MYLFSTSVSLMVWCSSNTTGKSLALLSTIQFVTTLQVCIKWLHRWDSIGIMFTAGTLDWYNSQYIGRESVDTWPIYWSTVSRHSVDSQSTVGQQSVNSQLTVGQPTASSRWEEHLTWLTIRHFVKFPWQLTSTHFSPGYREGRENATQWLGWDLNPEVWTQCLPLLS